VLNVVVLIGRLTRDPELRYTGAGVGMARFTLAVDRPFTDAQGQRGTDFIGVVCWRQLAETVSQHLKKGRLVAVQGSLHIRKYQTPEGEQRKVAEVSADQVRFLDRPPQPGSAADAGEEGEEADATPF
jgi:single-strand DNA-binding protein